MKFRKRLAAGILAAVMAVSEIPAGVSAEASGGEWTDEDTFNSMLYSSSHLSGEFYSDHAEFTHTVPIVHLDDRETALGALTGNNSLLITADQLKSDEYNDKVCLSFNFSFENHLNLAPNFTSGEVSLMSVDGSFSSTEIIVRVPLTSIGKAYCCFDVSLKKEDLQSGIMIRLTEETEENKYVSEINKLVRLGNPLYLRNVKVNNIYNYEKAAILEGISGDLDALGSITIPPSMLAAYPAGNEKRPGALLCPEYDVKSDITQSLWIGLDYWVPGETSQYAISGIQPYFSNLNQPIALRDNRPKKNGLTVKYGTDTDGTVYHGAILKSVSVYLPVGVTYPAESGYQSVGESAADLAAGKLSVQKTSVQDGKYDARLVKKVNTSELSGKSKAVFSLTNGTKTASVSTDKYYTSLTVDGETISAESGTVFLAYTVKNIPENVNVTAANIILE